MEPPEDWDDDDFDPAEWGEPVAGTANAVEVAMAGITAVLQRLHDARQEPPTDDELRDWLSSPPSQWPGTPPLATWAAMDASDPLLRSEVPEGHLWNLLDSAVELLTSVGVIGQR